MNPRLVITARARRNIDMVDTWWRANRLDSPDLFAQEFFAALDGLARDPVLGGNYESRGRHYRRWLLPKTRFHIYYLEAGDSLAIVSVWSAQRLPPRL